MYSEVHIFKVSTLMNFDLYGHTWNHHHGKDNKHNHHPRTFPHATYESISPFSAFPFQTIIDLLCVTID